jgi:ethanolamine utilization protein EutA
VTASGDDRHSLADHALGALFGHRHDGHDHDHDHDHDEAFADEAAARPLISLGLDIGSSSTQAAFARLSAEDGSAGEPFYLSTIMLTPIRADGAIDEAALWRIVDGFFEKAGVSPDEVDTGAVLLTGLAARSSNAAAIGARVADMAGDLVCTAAGDHIEALLAAHGSGAVAISAERRERLLLVDIGGATTKLAIACDGVIEATAALAVGGRLIAIDRDNRIVRLDPMGAVHATEAGFEWVSGERITPADLASVGLAMANRVADAIEAVIRGEAAPDSAMARMLTPWPSAGGPIDAILFSGGVAEYVYARETRDFGDVAPALGKALRRRIDAAGTPRLIEPRERIRATVLGASSHAMQLSGDTIYLSSHARLLPRRNLPVVRPALDLSGDIDPAALAHAIRAERERLGWLDREVAVAVPWRGVPTHARVRALAEGIAGGMQDRLASGDALYVMTEGDIARSLGAILTDELALAAEVLVIDGVTLRAFDHVDLGRIRLPSGRVPVTIKSLRFGTRLAATG